MNIQTVAMAGERWYVVHTRSGDLIGQWASEIGRLRLSDKLRNFRRFQTARTR
jgi:hypothetical protein